MCVSDPVGDMLARIKNAQAVSKRSVLVPYSRHKEAIASVLEKEGYIRSYAVKENEKKFKDLVLELKYYDGKGVISVLRRVSKPGRRVYSSIHQLPLFYNGLGINILSTSLGVMSDTDARKASVGGEVLCAVF